MKRLTKLLLILTAIVLLTTGRASAERKQRSPQVKAAVRKALDYLATQQSPQGYWQARSGQYRVAMTALAGLALLCEGSSTTGGKYHKNITRAVNYLVANAKPNGLIGYKGDYRYTYGHGYSMLFLSQVYGDEEDPERRKELRKVLTKAVDFSRNAQTTRGGWGYVSAKEGNDFDEGSTCITQVQGLRACRNAGIPVPKDVIDRAKKYIFDCMVKTGSQKGGIYYSFKSRSRPRPAITAAACAAMFNSGEYKSANVKAMLEYCKKNVWPGAGGRTSRSHWHYCHFYYAQVVYRLGDKDWKKYMADVGKTLVRQQSANGSWATGSVGPVFTTSVNVTILQLDKGFIPIFQR